MSIRLYGARYTRQEVGHCRAINCSADRIQHLSGALLQFALDCAREFWERLLPSPQVLLCQDWPEVLVVDAGLVLLFTVLLLIASG